MNEDSGMTTPHPDPSPSQRDETGVVVPREPTEEMLREGIASLTMPWSDVIPPGEDHDTYVMGMVWSAMVDAAPTPAQGGAGEPKGTMPCGGCGAKTSNERCLGCAHDFGDDASKWTRAPTPSADGASVLVPRTKQVGEVRDNSSPLSHIRGDRVIPSDPAKVGDAEAMPEAWLFLQDGLVCGMTVYPDTADRARAEGMEVRPLYLHALPAPSAPGAEVMRLREEAIAAAGREIKPPHLAETISETISRSPHDYAVRAIHHAQAVIIARLLALTPTPTAREEPAKIEAAAERVWHKMAERGGNRRRIAWADESEDEKERCRDFARAALMSKDDGTC